MTVYEILAILTPTITSIGIAIVGYVLKNITTNINRLDKRIDRVEIRQDKIDDELKQINSRLGKIEGLLEGYFAGIKHT